MTGAESLQLFQQLVAGANSLFLSDEDFVTINGVTKPTLKKIYAEFLASMGVYTTVAAGLAATSGTGTNNRFFTVQAAGDKAEVRYRNDAGVAVEVSSLLSWNADSLTINRGKVYPLRRMTRNGITSADPTPFVNAILNVSVIGARPGKYYRVAYFVNGATNVPGAYPNGWIIEEIDQANYATAANPAIRVIDIVGVEPPTVVRDGIQTVVLASPVVSGMTIIVTLDTAELPPYGTEVRANNIGQYGYSHIIDPSRYIPPVSGGSVTPVESVSAVAYTVTATHIDITWSDGVDVRGFRFGPNGANLLPNFIGTLKNGVLISTFSTDWLPPITFEVAGSGDGRTGAVEFTGGNHKVDDKLTAQNVSYIMEADGIPLKTGDHGTANRITCRIINKLMANNTVSLGRYALLQSFQVEFAPGSVSVNCEVVALEDLQTYIDYGCQIVTTGVNDTLFYLGGQFPAPIPWDGKVISGSVNDYRDAWAVLTTSAQGQLCAWMDREYGIAASRQVVPERGLIRGGGDASTKQYTTAYNKWNVRGPSNMIPLAAGARYQWRGGYSWGPVDVKAGMVASTRYLDGGRIRRADAVSALTVLNP